MTAERLLQGVRRFDGVGFGGFGISRVETMESAVRNDRSQADEAARRPRKVTSTVAPSAWPAEL